MKKENIKSERVNVYVRMRPFTDDETKKDNTTPVETFDTTNNIMVVKKEFDKKNFNFDKILPPNIKQSEVFDKSAKDVLDSVIKGYNGTIFAYGQTGTGKTYTMVGDFENNSNKGIIPRSFEYLFDSIKDNKEFKYNISISFIQIYLETIQDLIEPSNENIRIREDPELGVYLEGTEWIRVTNLNQCRQVFLIGEKNRATASTKMNLHSSRSHAIMIVKIEKTLILSQEKLKELTLQSNEKILQERVMTRSNLFLVDLAGSERVKKTKADNMRLEEAKKINYSLLVLGNCISSLTDPKSNHISYRDSKLTRLLQESLGGNAKTALIVTISPSSYNLEETVSSLQFGQRAMKVTNKPIINKSVDYQALSIKLQEDLDKLNDSYVQLKIEYDKVSEENKKLKNSETFLDFRRKSLNSNTNIDNETSPFNKTKNKSNPKEELQRLEQFYEEVFKNKAIEMETMLNDIDKLLLEKETEIEDLKKDNEIFKRKLFLIKDLEKEKEEYLKTITEISNELEDLKNKTSNEEINKTYIEKANQLNIKINRDLDSNTKILENIIDKLSLDIDIVKSKLNESFEINIKNEEKIQDLEANNNKCNTLIEELNKELKNNFETIDKQRSVLKLNQEYLNKYEADMVGLNIKISNLEQKAKEDEKSIKTKATIETDLNNDISDLNQTIEALKSNNQINTNNNQETISNLEKDNNLILKERDQLSRSLSLKEDENKKYGNEMKILNIKLKESENSKIELKNQIKKLTAIESDHKELLKESVLIQNKITDLESKIINQLNIIKEKELTIQTLQYDKDKLLESENILTKQIADLTLINKNNIEELKQLEIKLENENNINASTNNSNLQAILDSNNENTKLKQELETEKQNIKEFNTEIQNIKILLQNKEDSINILTVDIEHLKNELKEQTVTINNKNKEIDKLNYIILEFENNLKNDIKIKEDTLNHYKILETEKTNQINTLSDQLTIHQSKFDSETKFLNETITQYEKYNYPKQIELLKQTQDNLIKIIATNTNLLEANIKNFIELKDNFKDIEASFTDINNTESIIETILTILEQSEAFEYISNNNIKFTKPEDNNDLSQLFTVISEINTYFTETIKTLYHIIEKSQNVINYKNKQEASIKLELELSKKNEQYLKNSILFVAQKLKDQISQIIIDDNIIQTLDIKFKSLQLDNTNTELIEFNKIYLEFIESINQTIYNSNIIKDTEIEQLHQKTINYIRELEAFKTNEKQANKKDVKSVELLTLQNQILLKEEANINLTQKIDDLTIKLKQLTNNSNNINNTLNINILNSQMNNYELEITNLKNKIKDQYSTFETERQSILNNYTSENNIKQDKLKRKDVNTGRYLLKDYFQKVLNFAETLNRDSTYIYK